MTFKQWGPSNQSIYEPICASITEHAHQSGVTIIRLPELGRAQDFQKLAESLTQQFISIKDPSRPAHRITLNGRLIPRSSSSGMI